MGARGEASERFEPCARHGHGEAGGDARQEGAAHERGAGGAREAIVDAEDAGEQDRRDERRRHEEGGRHRHPRQRSEHQDQRGEQEGGPEAAWLAPEERGEHDRGHRPERALEPQRRRGPEPRRAQPAGARAARDQRGDHQEVHEIGQVPDGRHVGVPVAIEEHHADRGEEQRREATPGRHRRGEPGRHPEQHHPLDRPRERHPPAIEGEWDRDA